MNRVTRSTAMQIDAVVVVAELRRTLPSIL